MEKRDMANSRNVWQKVFAGTWLGEARSVRETKDKGYICTGYTVSERRTDFDIKVVKLDASGNLVWEKTFGGEFHERSYSVQQTSDGGYVVAGYTMSFGAGGRDVYVLKLDANGNTLWERTFGGSGDDVAHSIQQTSDGGYIVGGYTESFGTSGKNIYVLKLDADGKRVWERTFKGTGDDMAHSVQQTSDGGYILAGRTRSLDTGHKEACVIKLDAKGDLVWQSTFSGTGDSIAFCVQETTDGGYIVAGVADSVGVGSSISVLKLNASGQLQWQKTYGGNTDNEAYSVQQTRDGGYIVAGYSGSLGFGAEVSAYVLKLNADGQVEWERILVGGGNDVARCVQQTSDGGYVVAGYTGVIGVYDFAYIVKMDAYGETDPYPLE